MSGEDCTNETNGSFSSRHLYSVVLDFEDIEAFVWPVLLQDHALLESFLWPEVISVSLTMTDEKDITNRRLDPKFRLYNLGRPSHLYYKDPLITRFGTKQKIFIPEQSLNKSRIQAIVLKESVGNIANSLRDKLNKYGSSDRSDGKQIKGTDLSQTFSHKQTAGYWKWETFPYCHVKWEEYAQEKNMERAKFSFAYTSNSEKFRHMANRKQYHRSNGKVTPQWKIHPQQKDQSYQITSTHSLSNSSTTITQQRNIFSTLCQSSLQTKSGTYSNSTGGQQSTSSSPISKSPKDEKKAYQKHASFSLKYQHSFHARAITRRDQPSLSPTNEIQRCPNKVQHVSSTKDCNKQDMQGAVHLFDSPKAPYFVRFPPPSMNVTNGPLPQNWHLTQLPFYRHPLPNDQRNFPIFTGAFPLNPQLQSTPGIYHNGGFPQPMNFMQPYPSIPNGRGYDPRMLQNCQHDFPGLSIYTQLPFLHQQNYHCPVPCHNQQQSFFLAQAPSPHGQLFPSFQTSSNQFTDNAHHKEREGGNSLWSSCSPQKSKVDCEKRNTGPKQESSRTSRSPIIKKHSNCSPQHSVSDSNLNIIPSNNSKHLYWGAQQSVNASFYPLAQGDFMFNQPWCYHAPFQSPSIVSQASTLQIPTQTISGHPHNHLQGNSCRSFKESLSASREIPKHSPRNCATQMKIPVMIRKRKVKKQPRKTIQTQDFKRQIPIVECEENSSTCNVDSVFDGLTDGETCQKTDDNVEISKHDEETNLDKAAVELKCLLGIKNDLQ